MDKETKQLSLLTPPASPVQKHFIVNGQSYYYRSAMSPGSSLKDAVLVYYKFKNEEKAGLDAVTCGTVRVYQSDSHGGILFIGEDRIDTRRRTKMSAFTSATRSTSSANTNKPITRKSIITLTKWNTSHIADHKETPVTVEVNEPSAVTGKCSIQLSPQENRRLRRAI